MTNSNLIGKENRLLHYTLAQIQEQQKKAGTTVSVAPVNARAAQEASKLQNANATTKGIGIGDNPNADLVERMVQTNFDYSKATPDEIKRHEAGMALAEGSQYVSAPGVNPARGVQTAQQQTYANQAAGLGTSFTKTPGQSIYDQTGTTQAAGSGDIQQSAIDRLRASGKTDEEIRKIMSDPEYMNAIRTTMSNTGLGGTDRRSAVLTPAQAQNILANSRNPRERAEAQKIIDEQVNQTKGYNDVPIYDDNGNIVGYNSVESVGKTAEAQQKERERLALEEKNRIESAKLAEERKKFIAGIDTSAMDQTKSQIDSMLQSIQNLSPELQAAVLPQLLNLQNSNNQVSKLTQEIIDNQQTDKEIEDQYGSLEEYVKSEDEKYKNLLERNKQTALDVAQYNKDALEIDKKIFEHDAAIAEQKQAAMNVDSEKKLRRQLNRLGIQTDVSALTYLQDEIQKGVTALEDLKKGNSLMSLKANLAIGEGYRLEVKRALEGYEGKYLEITSLTTDKLQSIKSSISNDKATRDKEIMDAKKWELEEKNRNDKEAREIIGGAYMSMIESKEKIAAQDRADNRADERMAFQERMAKERMIYSEAQADRRYAQGKIDDEMAEAKQVRAAFRAAEDQPEVKNYITIRDAYAKAKNTVDAALAGGKKIDIAVAKEVATVLYEKGLDPTSVVREGEYLRASKGQGWFDNLQLFAGAVKNGDLTGITVDSVNAFMDAMNTATETQRASALSRYTSDLNYLMDFNTRSSSVNVDPRTVSIPPELIRAEDLKAFLDDSGGGYKAKYDYDYGSYGDGMNNSTYKEDPKVTSPLIQAMPETGMTMDQVFSAWNGVQLLSTPNSLTIRNSTSSIGDTLAQLAPVTQGFNTPISTANYAASTVKAWGGTHKGLDLALPSGSFMPSVTDGVLEKVEYSDGGWGLTAIIRAPDGAEIRYSHLSSIDPTLTIGTKIQKGREIAQIGNTGNVFSTSGGDGTHLDLRIKKDGVYIDPFSYYS